MNTKELETIARKIRSSLIEMSHKAGTPHLGSSLSCVDLVVALYWGVMSIDPSHPQDKKRDRFILSKGHAATTQYATLAERGFFSMDVLNTYAKAGARLPEHPVLNSVPGIEATSGSLGHGLSLGLGMALAGRIQKINYRVFIVMSDGECNEGSVWEAALLAPSLGLDRLVVIIDYNKWQATGRSNEVTSLSPLKEKWKSFGWSSYEVDGHDMKALVDLLRIVPDGTGKPVAIISHTVKGKGISFMEDDNNWHYRIPNKEEVLAAQKELGFL